MGYSKENERRRNRLRRLAVAYERLDQPDKLRVKARKQEEIQRTQIMSVCQHCRADVGWQMSLI